MCIINIWQSSRPISAAVYRCQQRCRGSKSSLYIQAVPQRAFLDEQMTQKSLLPCTPLAVLKILDYLRVYNSILPYGNRLFGRSITVINRSETVGRPLAALLANDGACVYSVDVTGVQQFTRGAGIKRTGMKLLRRRVGKCGIACRSAMWLLEASQENPSRYQRSCCEMELCVSTFRLKRSEDFE